MYRGKWEGPLDTTVAVMATKIELPTYKPLPIVFIMFPVQARQQVFIISR